MNVILDRLGRFSAGHPWRALALWAADLRERSVDLEIHGAPHLVRRMWQLLDLSDIAPVSFVKESA